jgi:hypothetical protein
MSETNKKIHELLGRGCWHESSGETVGYQGEVYCKNCPCTYEPCPSYDTDISAAMEAVEWMRKERPACFDISCDGSLWWVEIEIGSRINKTSGIVGLPAAICEAILKSQELI